jgi:anthranilate phosphoribosyltransferase
MFAALLERLQRREDLTTEQAAGAMRAVMDGEATPAQIAGLLVALRMKGECPEEIVGFARTMRERGVTLSRAFPEAIDTCGTGGDGGGTFNVSTVAAFVAAGAGVTVAKHGNRSVSSRCGSADVLAALGVDVAAEPDVVERCLERAGIAFLFAPTFHPSMRHAAGPRRELGIRTAFNLLGPLTNPVGVRRQLVGVPRPELTELVARALAQLGSEWAWVVHGADGIDEVSTCGHTKVSECRNGAVRTFYVHPADAGIAKAARQDLAGGDAEHNAALALRVLEGEPGPRREVVLLNAGVSLMIAGRAAGMRQGVALAAAAVDSGAARQALRRLVEESTRKGNAQ